MKRPHTRLVIRTEFIEHNIRFLRKRIGPECQLIAVVKNNAYGHDLALFSTLCYEAGIRYFGIYHPSSLLTLFEELPSDCEFLLFGYAGEEEIKSLLSERVHFTVNNETTFRKLKNTANKFDRRANIHLEVESGMNRTGLTEDEAKSIIGSDVDSSSVRITGLYSHLSGDPVPENLSRVKQQFDRFRDFCQQNTIPQNIKLHLSNSFGVALQGENTFDFIRPGIALYGFWSSNEVERQLINSRGLSSLRPVMRWETTLMDIRTVPEDRFIGYGRSHRTSSERTIGIVPVGYGDGYPKQLENRGMVLVRGNIAPLVGSINMNLMQIDLSEITAAEIGDTVLLMADAEGPNSLRADVLAEESGRYLYEYLANISTEIVRVKE